ncbi:restriction endonuclease [Agromyces sp. ISL-38]|uniref:P-loop NTPase n=1 Tax=Agromyces sp. ISL-38 TaxID=2819107 RepID=UPI001BE85F96|nr:restriction endonuclease [Agromyces sp. ISL-38]MBT2499399.1 restriction endonuclease [Agromyces sp. ISL-38]
MTKEAVRRIAEGRNADLVPTPLLSPDEFEDFVERLLSVHRFCPEPLVHVTRVERWGRKGDKQDGIDFEGDFSDGASAAWQCKRQDALSASDVKAYIAAGTFTADRYYLAFSGEASSEARKEMLEHPKWELLDQRGLGRMLQDLPLHKRRQVLDDTWGPQWRRQYLQTPGEDAFLSMEQVLAARTDENNLINDRGILVGRDRELEELRTALNRDRDWPSVIVVAGAGGRGKSRILAQALSEAEQDSPQIPILTLGPGRQVDVDALKELPQIPATIFVDDIHRDPDQLSTLLAYQRSVEGTQLILGSRGRASIRSRMCYSEPA